VNNIGSVREIYEVGAVLEFLVHTVASCAILPMK